MGKPIPYIDSELDTIIYKNDKLWRVIGACRMMAKKTKCVDCHGFQEVELGRGQFITTLAQLSEKTGLSIPTVRHSLEKLQDMKKLTSKGTNKFRIITIIESGVYDNQE